LSITVACTIRPLPEHVESVVQGAGEQLAASVVPGRRSARLYRLLGDRTTLLYVAEWESSEAFESYRPSAPMCGSADLYRQPPACRFYRRLALFERVLVPIQQAYGIVVDGPTRSHSERRDLALSYHRASLQVQPDLVQVTVHETVDTPPGLLLLTGWRSAGVVEIAEPTRGLIERLRATGATVEELIGHAVADAADA
jgi:hypothetical protein